MATRILAFLVSIFTLAACGGHADDAPTPDDAPAYACTLDSYALPDAMPGSVYLACGPVSYQTFVMSGGTARGRLDGGCLELTVETIDPAATGGVVVQLRGPGGKPMCADTFERVTP